MVDVTEQGEEVRDQLVRRRMTEVLEGMDEDPWREEGRKGRKSEDSG